MVHLSTADPLYGGTGTPPLEGPDCAWHIPGECALVLAPSEDGA
jgi:maltooligosyltrehalose trehalohydrolase